MGSGVVLKCKKCHYELDATLGSGFCYPMVCEEILQKLRQGEFGEEMMQIVNSTPNVAIHEEKAIFLCDDCGNLQVDSLIEICEPTPKHTKREARYSVAVDYPNNTSYVMDREIEFGDFKVLRRVQCKCERCNKSMTAISKSKLEKTKLRCPKCNEKMVLAEHYFWD